MVCRSGELLDNASLTPAIGSADPFVNSHADVMQRLVHWGDARKCVGSPLTVSSKS